MDHRYFGVTTLDPKSGSLYPWEKHTSLFFLFFFFLSNNDSNTKHTEKLQANDTHTSSSSCFPLGFCVPWLDSRPQPRTPGHSINTANETTTKSHILPCDRHPHHMPTSCLSYLQGGRILRSTHNTGHLLSKSEGETWDLNGFPLDTIPSRQGRQAARCLQAAPLPAVVRSSPGSGTRPKQRCYLTGDSAAFPQSWGNSFI